MTNSCNYIMAIQLPHGANYTELYLRAYKTDTDKSVRVNRPFPNSNRQQQIGMYWGAKNNFGVGKRFNCPFRHSCTQCQGNHPVNRWWVGRPSHLVTNPNQNRKSVLNLWEYKADTVLISCTLCTDHRVLPNAKFTLHQSE